MTHTDRRDQRTTKAVSVSSPRSWKIPHLFPACPLRVTVLTHAASWPLKKRKTAIMKEKDHQSITIKLKLQGGWGTGALLWRENRFCGFKRPQGLSPRIYRNYSRWPKGAKQVKGSSHVIETMKAYYSPLVSPFIKFGLLQHSLVIHFKETILWPLRLRLNNFREDLER